MLEPAIVTRLLQKVDVHGTAAAELFLALYALRAVMLAVTALVALTGRTVPRHRRPAAAAL